ncbi:MAG TPA: hypothetical protein VM364_05860 [Vicinamibacterales bacterium]|nr:hypothetical protein [Vicinamibacterales bacterium]
MPRQNVLQIRKLRTSEDESLHEEIARINAADGHARDIVLAGAAVLHTEVEAARFDEALDDLIGNDDASVAREQWAYYLGLCVGLHLQGLQR